MSKENRNPVWFQQYNTFKKREEVIKSSAIEEESLDLSRPAQVSGRGKPALPVPESLTHHPSDSELPKKVFPPERRTEIEKPPFHSAKEAGYALRKKRESQTKKEKRQFVKQQEIRKLDLASFQALEKIKDSEGKFKSSKDISDEEKIDVINKTAAFVQDIFEACQDSIPFEEALRLAVISAEVEQLLLKHPEIRQSILESHKRLMAGDETGYVGIEEMEKIFEENRPQGRTLSGTDMLDSV